MIISSPGSEWFDGKVWSIWFDGSRGMPFIKPKSTYVIAVFDGHTFIFLFSMFAVG